MGISFSSISRSKAVESFPPDNEMELKLLLFSLVFIGDFLLCTKNKPRKA